MPLHKSISVNSETSVKIWEITESFESLFEAVTLTQKSLDRVNGMKSELHQRGFLSVRHLLHTYGYTDADLYYNDEGKPFLRDGKHISITHSFEYAAVIVSDTPVGIDIEKQRDKITRIASKFVNTSLEYLEVGDAENIMKLTKIWCAKEAIYKLKSIPGLSFKDSILIIPFAETDMETTGWTTINSTKTKSHLNFINLNGFCCGYVS